MSKFEILTKYIPGVKVDNFGEWLIDYENDGTPEHPIHMPFVIYTDMVNAFIEDVYHFVEDNKDFELNSSGGILSRNGIEWGRESIRDADVDSLTGHYIIDLIMSVIQTERFCDGALLSFFKNGSILKLLERLKEIDSI